MQPTTIYITHIGLIARELLSEEREAAVMGVTSRGLFLHLLQGWVVFITSENYRGPLTLNLQGDQAALRDVKVHSPVVLTSDRIDFLTANLTIPLANASIWQAPVPPTNRLPTEKRKACLVDITHRVLARGKSSDIGALLPALIDPKEAVIDPEDPLFQLLQRVLRSLENSELPALVDAIQALLGLGSGLTPSGDDLTLGLLLALNRWGHVLAPSLDTLGLNRRILPQAYQKTTTLSANLIECACRGQANERLIIALDGLVTGAPEATTCADTLADWGNTSGLDALAGMAMVITG